MILKEKNIGLKDAKLIVGNSCWGDEASFWSEGYPAVIINSIYKYPYAETKKDLLKHIDLDNIAQALKVTMLLLSSWDSKVR